MSMIFMTTPADHKGRLHGVRVKLIVLAPVQESLSRMRAPGLGLKSLIDLYTSLLL